MKRMIYLDNAAATPVRPEVFLAMKPYFGSVFGNPGSITKIGVTARQAAEEARRIVADHLSARPKEIVFTSGGTEANNLAIFGSVKALESAGRRLTDMHFITTVIEHSSILECFRDLEKRGADVSYLQVGENGLLDPKDLRAAIRPETVLVSIGYANSEIGVIQPIVDLAREIRRVRKERAGSALPVFHIDASQAGLYLNLNVLQLGVDLMTVDAQKIGGPKGSGALFAKDGTAIQPIILGGGQESGRRSGTENVPGLVGLAAALRIVRKNYEKKAVKMKTLRDRLWQKIQQAVPTAVLNGDPDQRLPNNLNFSVPGLDAEFAVLCLDEKGIVCSARSACASQDGYSSVLRALGGKSGQLAGSALRFSLGDDLTARDLSYIVSSLKTVIGKQNLCA